MDEIFCDGCNVRPPHEHRCHSIGRDGEPGRIMIRGEGRHGVCGCQECKEPTAEELAEFLPQGHCSEERHGVLANVTGPSVSGRTADALRARDCMQKAGIKVKMVQGQKGDPVNTERRQPGSSYKHGEAFCLMRYRDEVTDEVEILWNSRDGVTPFTIMSKAGNPATHTNWGADVRDPDHEPNPGDRVFVDMTKERAQELAQEYVDKWWDQEILGITMAESYEGSTKEDVVRVFAVDYMAEPDVRTWPIDDAPAGGAK